MERDARIDAYIAAAAPFARPILTQLREHVHAAIDGLEETIKWSCPHFVYRGKNLAGMAAFKKHCAFVIHKEAPGGDGRGQYGRMATMEQVPDAGTLAARLLEVAARIDDELAMGKPKRRKPSE